MRAVLVERRSLAKPDLETSLPRENRTGMSLQKFIVETMETEMSNPWSRQMEKRNQEK